MNHQNYIQSIALKDVQRLTLLAGAILIVYLLAGFLASVATLGVAIICHEFGHWTPARMVGVGVSHFSIGFGKPVYVCPKKIWGTTFQICAVPLGGYIRPIEVELNAAAIWKRAVFFAGGPCMNLICAALIMFASYMIVGEPQQFVTTASAIAELDSKITAAYDSGLRVGDVIVTIEGKSAVTYEEIFAALEAHKSSPIALKVKRGDSELALTLNHDANQKLGIRGIQAIGEIPYLSVGTGRAAADAVKETARQSFLTLEWIGKVMHIVPKAKTEQVSVNDVQSLIGIVQTGGEFFHKGLASFLLFAAVINLSLGVLNLLPFPGFDGGHLMFLAIEKVRGKPVPIMIQRWLTFGTIAAFLLLTLYATQNDLIRIVGEFWATPILVVLVCALVRYLVPPAAWIALGKALYR